MTLWDGLMLGAAGPLALTVINALTWPRGTAGTVLPGTVSALVPARNEESAIEACVRRLAAEQVHEIIVCDDQSTDETPRILARLQQELPNLRVIPGIPLPEGWVGKPHACHRLAAAATGDRLLFVDADTFLQPQALKRLDSLMADADCVTAVPRQVLGSFGERLMLPLLHLTYTAWLPLALIPRSKDPRFVAANGQIVYITREAYARIGGHEAVRQEVVEDMVFCRRVKEVGDTLVFADGHDIARCRMYSSGREVWEGFSKNLFEGLGESLVLLAGVLTLHLVCFVLPYLALPWLGSWALAGIALNVALRLLMALRWRQPLSGVLLHPLAVLGLCGIALNSMLWSRRGQIRWAGRSYVARSAR